jgi:hypothetical protein
LETYFFLALAAFLACFTGAAFAAALVDFLADFLAGAALAGAALAGADLAGADLAGADLAGADLAGADLATAAGLPEATFFLPPKTRSQLAAYFSLVPTRVIVTFLPLLLHKMESIEVESENDINIDN